ncbi:hypothetical protein K456DRAFT_1936082 [Colletotrichum gloeosporioides 23]|nr:hypothetical protein K456DRAFT_1936082 [Colletotrichum gloeosporioides 23]
MAGSSAAAIPPNIDWGKWSLGHNIFHEKRWQQILDSQDEDFKRAKLAFLRLEVYAGDLSELVYLRTKVTDDLRKYVQHIWLNAAFRKCECQPDEAEPDAETIQHKKQHVKLLQDAVTHLFKVLADWKEPGPNGNGIAIELSAQSFSYKSHFNFDKSYLGSRDEIGARLKTEVVHKDLGISAFADYTKSVHQDMTFRFCSERMPTLPGVTKFVLRRQFRHSLMSPPEDYASIRDFGLKAIFRTMPNLECLVYEPWRAWDDKNQRLYDLETSVFEDNNESYARRIAGVDRLLRVRNPSLGQAVARASQQLKTLSVAFMVEAEDFFTECMGKEGFQWPHLKSLALTSRLLAHNDHNLILDMLKNAAKVAERMPYLNTMTVWFGAKHKAYCLAYHHRDGRSRIAWQGTEPLLHDPELIEFWATVAGKHRTSFLGFEQPGLSDIDWKLRNKYFAGLAGGLISAQELKSHGDAVFLLGDYLPEDVVDRVSLWQMQQEARVL